MNLLPLTELEAVNFLLETIGESPVNSLVVSGVSEVSIAQSILHNTSRNHQARGWFYNTEYLYPLPLDSNGEVPLPSNALQVDPTDNTKKYTTRGSRLYDLTNHTYVFTESPKVDIVFFLAFDELPQAARNYVTVAAAREFQRKVVGSDTLNKITEEEEGKALTLLMDLESDYSDSSIFDSYSVQRPIMRYSNPYPVGGR